MTYQWTTEARDIVKCLDTGMSFPKESRYYDDIVRENVPIAEPSFDFDAVKTRLFSRVDADAEGMRLRYITPGSGKAMSYQEKLAEARLILDDPANVTADLVPILAAEAQARGVSIETTADLVHSTYLSFKTVEAQINAICISAKAAISSASDAAAAQAAYEAITWPTTP